MDTSALDSVDQYILEDWGSPQAKESDSSSLMELEQNNKDTEGVVVGVVAEEDSSQPDCNLNQNNVVVDALVDEE